ncbi:Hypothetical predicted protein [Cloeon dipterum]|uniref:ZP domain-containing protein n=1 Tax=Cloeon dipterum TaxID=197152 RepID=A0A8S1C114_9INSE|nr:Hypothetical predicted protein [Cloeon dipterum]
MSVSVPTKKLNKNGRKISETGHSAGKIRRNGEYSTGSKRRQSETSFESKRTRVEEKTDYEASKPKTADEYAEGESPSDKENLLQILNSNLYYKPSRYMAKAYPNYELNLIGSQKKRDMRSNGVGFMLAVIVAVVHGQIQVLFEDEVAAFAKSVNELAENPSIARNVRQPQIFADPIENLPNGVLLNTRIQNDGGQHHHHQDGAHSHTHLTRLDVTCSSGNMRVELEFDGPYNGIVYSKGHATNRRCRFINKDSARGSFNFVVPIDSCGPVGDERRGTDETILVFQNDESVIEVWDVARRIQCPKVERKIVKTITFNPFTVGRILVEEGPTPNETVVECWMDILVGENPCRGKTAKDKVKIGDDMSAVIYVKDGGSNYDILVKDCFAHDQEQLTGRDTTSVQLSDSSGCPKKEKLLGQFRKYPQTCSGADLVAYAPMSAFKFADRPSVYLTCVVELCPGQCDQCGVPTNRSTVSVCPTELHGVDPKCPPFVCTPQLVGRDSRCPKPTPPPPTAFVCTPRLRGRDPRCPTPPPPTPPPTTTFVALHGSLDVTLGVPRHRTTPRPYPRTTPVFLHSSTPWARPSMPYTTTTYSSSPSNPSICLHASARWT